MLRPVYTVPSPEVTITFTWGFSLGLYIKGIISESSRISAGIRWPATLT